MTFFQKVQFLQNCSVTQNTVFRYVKNNFLLPQKKLVFFTILNLDITHDITHNIVTFNRRCYLTQHMIFNMTHDKIKMQVDFKAGGSCMTHHNMAHYMTEQDTV